MERGNSSLYVKEYASVTYIVAGYQTDERGHIRNQDRAPAAKYH